MDTGSCSSQERTSQGDREGQRQAEEAEGQEQDADEDEGQLVYRPPRAFLYPFLVR